MSCRQQPKTQSLSNDLALIAEKASGSFITIAEIDEILEGRSFASICLLLSIPFVQPIPLPGLSVVFGAAISALGLRIALGSHASLPQFIKKRQIETKTLHKTIEGLQKIFNYLERLFHPRCHFFLENKAQNLIGASLIFNGLALCLPLPPVILFSNSIPAWSVIFLSLGYLQRDGLFVAFGHVLTVVTWIYFAIWSELILAAIKSFHEYF